MTTSEGSPPELPDPVFRKTKQGTWAVMGPITTLQAAMAENRPVQVKKRSGDFSTFTVISLGRPFDVDGVAMCYGYDRAAEIDPSEPNAPAERSSHAPNAPASRRSARSTPPPAPEPSIASPPSRDPSEPLPEYQGGPEDEWHGDF